MNQVTNVKVNVELTILELKHLERLQKLADALNDMYDEDDNNEIINKLWNEHGFALGSNSIQNLILSVKKDLQEIVKNP